MIASSSPAGDELLTRADRNGVFDVHRLGVLSPGEASEVLTATASQRGVTFDPAAHDRVLQFSRGHPQRLQLAAHEAWMAMPAGSRVIDGIAASRGVDRATTILDRQVHTPRWQRLTPAEQALAQTLAQQGGSSRARELSSLRAHLPAEHRAGLEATHQGLIRKDVAHELAGGKVRFNDPGTEGWILRNRPPTGTAQHVLQGSPAIRQVGSQPPNPGQRPSGHQPGDRGTPRPSLERYRANDDE